MAFDSSIPPRRSPQAKLWPVDHTLPSDAELNAAWMEVHAAYSDAEEADRVARQAWAAFVEKRAVAVRLLEGVR